MLCPTSILLWWIDQMTTTFHGTTKKFPVATFCLNIRELQILCVIPVGSTVAERSFSCIRHINNWLHNSILTDLLGDLAIIAVHGHTIIILKADTRNAYVSIDLLTLVGWWHYYLLLTINLLDICLI